MSSHARNSSGSGWRPILRFIAPHWRIILIGSLVAVVAATVSLLQPLVVQELIAQAQKTSSISAVLVITGIILVLFAATLQYVQARLMGSAGEDVVFGVRRQLIQRMLRLPIREYDHRSPGDLISRVTNDTMSLRSAVASGLVDAVGAVVTVVGATVAMLIIDPFLALVGVGILVATAWAVRVVGGHVHTAAHDYQRQIGRVASMLDRSINAITTIRAFNATTEEERSLLASTEQTRESGRTLARAAAPFSPMNYLSTQLLLMVVFAIGGVRVASGGLSIAALISFVLFLMIMAGPLGQLINAVAALQLAAGATQRVQGILGLRNESDPEPEDEQRHTSMSSAPTVSFEQVSYSIDASMVLNSISFDVPAGGLVGIIGASGAGKTTLFSLLERFDDPSDGCVRIDGVDIETMTRCAVRSGIAYVEQDAPALAGTIRENITLGTVNATDEQCWEVLEQVRLGDVVRARPHGLDTMVGNGGVTLSGGERQRLAIARSLLSQRKLLLLDEPTSGLDSVNEALLNDTLLELRGAMTILFTAHRHSTIKHADAVVIVEHGRAIATGSPAVLQERSDQYRELLGIDELGAAA